MEILAHKSYLEKEYPVAFWRTKTGLEVDFVLSDGEVAIEVKGSSNVSPRDLRPIRAFVEEYCPRKAIVVCNESEPRIVDQVEIIPWRIFLQKLWGGDIL